MNLQLAQDIVALHAAHLQTGTPPAWADCVRPEDGAHGEQAAAVLAACRSMGFVEDDAQLLARAWTAQALRLGQFDATAWPDDARDFGVHTGPRADAFAPCPQQLGLYAVLPDAAWVARMAEAGVPTLQLRFKSDDRAAVAREVQAAVRAVQGSASLLFINDHWREAIDAGAYGVHLGQEDLEGAREQLPEERRLVAGAPRGVECRGVRGRQRAQLRRKQAKRLIPGDRRVMRRARPQHKRLGEPALRVQPVVAPRRQFGDRVAREELPADAQRRRLVGHRLGAVLAELEGVPPRVRARPRARLAVEAVGLVNLQQQPCAAHDARGAQQLRGLGHGLRPGRGATGRAQPWRSGFGRGAGRG